MVLDFLSASLSSLSSYSIYAPLALRLVVGFLYAFHGYPEVFGHKPSGGEKFMTSLGIPAPAFFALATGIFELAGGLALMAGLFTRVFAALLFVHMAAVVFLSIFRLKKPYSIGYELDMLLLASLFAVATIGGGSLSVDALLA